MRYLEQFVSILGDYVSAVRPGDQDILFPGSIRFLEGETETEEGCYYLAEMTTLRSVEFASITFPKDTCLIICRASRTDALKEFSNLEGINIVLCSATAPRVFNRLSSGLKEYLSSDPELLEGDKADPLQAALCELWDNIMDRKILSHSEVQGAIMNLLPQIRKFIRVICVNSYTRPTACKDPAVLSGLRELLPDTCAFSYQRNSGTGIVCLQFFDTQPFDHIENMEALENYLEKEDLYMMISNSTSDYARLETIYVMSDRSNYLAYTLRRQENRIYFFERYSMYMLIDLCTESFRNIFSHEDILYLIHPAIVYLSRYDRKHGTNLRDVLFYYLLYNQDVKKTAEYLYMHRNTVSNKISLIKNICPITFDDGGLNQRLLLSCQVVMYYEKVLEQRLKESSRDVPFPID